MDPAFVIGAFLIVLVLVCAIGTPYRNFTRRQPAAGPAPQPRATPQPRTAQGQATYPPPDPGHRYVIHDGKIVQVRVS